MSEEAIRKDEDEDVEAHGGGPRPGAAAEPRDDEGEDEPDVEAHGGGPRPT
jgi:hypothetical protein